MAAKSRELKAAGVDVINLSIGEPDFDTPLHIKEAAKKAIDDNYSHYTPIPGLVELRQAIANKLKTENKLVYSQDQIVVSTGAKHSIANVLFCLLNPGDEVIIPAPYWVSYIEMVKLAEGTPVVVQSSIENDFVMSPQELEAAITPKTKAILYSSPSNPTGSLYSREDLAAYASILQKHPNIIVISDEIYEHINYEGSHESIAQFESIRDRVVIVNGVSKGYAMTGWRIGFIAAPLWIAKAAVKLQGQFTSGACAVAQMAAKAAFEGGLESTYQMREEFLKRRDLVYNLVKAIPHVNVRLPKGAFYLLPDISYYLNTTYEDRVIKTSDDLCIFLLEVGHVACVGGDSFGAPNCIRFSYAASQDLLVEGMKRISSTLSLLKKEQ
ncbi:MAG: pyridoxal phosphate-dependent aminotransferase [Breznakibacter sp.]|nr:pyridoxal phosphate-dependent aminotransferase [Breznakibacter sp.]